MRSSQPRKCYFKKVYVRIPIFSFTRWPRNDFCEQDGRRSGCVCDLLPLQFTLPTVCDVFIRRSQLVQQASPGSALHRSSHSIGVDGPQVLLSQPWLFSQSVHGATPRFHCSLFSPDQATAYGRPRHRVRYQWERRRTARWQAGDAHFRCQHALVSLSRTPA